MLGTEQLAPALDIVRISLHVLAAAVWIGGQVVLAGLLPTVRGFGEGASTKIAQAFGRLSWPAFIVLIATGLWNVAALHNGGDNKTWAAVMGAKYAVVLAAGVAVFWHTKTKTAALRGATAGIGLLASLVAMVLGVALAG